VARFGSGVSPRLGGCGPGGFAAAGGLAPGFGSGVSPRLGGFYGIGAGGIGGLFGEDGPAPGDQHSHG
jgi:hypothetical protein